MSSGIGAECKAEFSSRISQIVQHATRTHARDALHRIYFEDLVDVLHPINYHGGIATLPGEARAAAARENRRAKFARDGYGCDNVLNMARNDDANRNLAIIRSVHRLNAAAAAVKTHFAIDFSFERLFQPANLDVDRLSFCRFGFGIRSDVNVVFFLQWNGGAHARAS